MKIDKRTSEGKKMLTDIRMETMLSKSEVRHIKERASEIQLDVRQEHRLDQGCCIRCYYRVTIGGQKISSYVCKICKEGFSHPNTTVPQICLKCGKDNNICVMCCSEMYRKFEC